MKTPTLVLATHVADILKAHQKHLNPGATRPDSWHIYEAPPGVPTRLGSYLDDVLSASIWLPRSRAEEDESYRQLIPYVSIWGTDGKVLTYRRPGKGEGESRLQGQLSVGFGGHIDQPDYAAQGLPTPDIHIDPASHLHGAMDRELREEAGVRIFDRPPSPVWVARDPTHLPQLRSVICLHDAQVSRVHLGIHYTWKPDLTPADRNMYFTFAPDEIHEPQWSDPRELANDPALETWSRFVIDRHLV